ncbi:MAG TPA: proton-conducting transporter membrane subunit [bacterium]|nr:proton-conducting transporter membrane subunit [bacterium]HOL35849.1 proton-conducting transporter membrane subunit [bacterium]HPP08104.1 proton-conducting transporter membrane subunit [bacterium]
MNREWILFFPIIVPAVSGIICFCIPDSLRKLRNAIALLSGIVLIWIASLIYRAGDITYISPWFISTINFSLKSAALGKFIMLWISIFSFLITLYVTEKMTSERLREFTAYLLITTGLACGAVLANSFVLLLFFWEGLLVTLYLFILLGGEHSFRTALKAFVLVGLCDFCLILGTAIYWKITGSFDFPAKPLELAGMSVLSFILMAVGATGKAGALPFHTWIPDAAIDAPVSFMALLPAALEKLLGIYLLTRICLDFFAINPGSSASIGLMSLGAITIVVAVCMALIQKNIKRLLSYHAISQVGYMIVGIGTGVPAGVVGGIFHMLNHTIYKAGLFLSAGSVEHRTRITDLKSLGGLFRHMPVTGTCFVICAAAISGIWPLNGYVSKEMIIHGSLETGYKIFAIGCWVGAILTLASFLKAGHSIFFGEKKQEFQNIRENNSAIVMPMMILAFLCIFFGLFNRFPIDAITRFVPEASHHDFSTHALNLFNPVSGITVLCLISAFLLHRYGWIKNGKKPYLASEVVHNLPGIKILYNLAERRVFDAYEQGIRLIRTMALALYYGFDRTADWFYETLVVRSGIRIIDSLRSVHRGLLFNYIGWILAGIVVIIIFAMAF